MRKNIHFESLPEARFRLDLKDRRLLLALWHDGRAPLKRLAKQIGVSPEVVSYRLKRLTERGIFQGVQSRINHNLIGNDEYRVLLQLDHLTEEEEARLANDAKSLPGFERLLFLRGEYTLALFLATRSAKSCHDQLSRLLQQWGERITRREVVAITATEHLPPTMLLPGERDGFSVGGTFKEEELKDDEEELLRLLRRESRQSLLSLARKLKKPVSTTRELLLRLERIIACHLPIYDLSPLGYDHFLVKLRLHNPKTLPTIHELLRREDHVTTIIHPLAAHDLEFEGTFLTVEALFTFLEQLKGAAPLETTILFTKKKRK